ILLLAGVGALAATDLFSIRNSATDARAALTDAVEHLTRGETDQGLDRLATAREEIDDARSRTGSFGFRVARSMPFLGGDVRVVETSVVAASEVTSAVEVVADYLVSPHDPLYAEGNVDTDTAAAYT